MMLPPTKLAQLTKRAALICTTACLFCASCRAPIVWQDQAPSPNGRWIASAETIQNGGFGNASIYTSVYIKQTGIRAQATEVLSFSCEGPVPHAYVLDNKANAGGTINLTMKWASPSHLDVTYSGHAEIIFQAIKFAGVEISLEDLSPNQHKPSP